MTRAGRTVFASVSARDPALLPPVASDAQPEPMSWVGSFAALRGEGFGNGDFIRLFLDGRGVAVSSGSTPGNSAQEKEGSGTKKARRGTMQQPA